MNSAVLSASLTSDEAEFIGVVDAVVSERVEPVARMIGHSVDASELLGLLGESGLLLLGGSTSQGGGGARLNVFALAVQALARSSASVAWVVTQNHAAAAAVLGLEDGGVDLGDSLRLSMVDAPSSEQVKKSEDDRSVLTGTVVVRNYLGEQTRLVVGLRSEGYGDFIGISDLAAPGVTVRGPARRTGLNGDLSYELELEDVSFHTYAADQSLLSSSQVADIGIAASAIGIAQRATEEAAAHVGARRQFGRALIDFGGVRQILEGMRERLQRCSGLLHAAVEITDLDEPSAHECCSHAVASDAVVICTDAIQLLGGNGYMREGVVERLFRDALTLRARSSSLTVQTGLR